MRLARREVRRLIKLSRRRVRWPATSTAPPPAARSASARASRAGMSAGSFCPSPSRVAIQKPLEARTPGDDRRTLAASDAMPQHTHALGRAQYGGGVVVAAVVHIDDLVRDTGQRGADFGDEGIDIGSLVADGDNDGNERCGHGGAAVASEAVGRPRGLCPLDPRQGEPPWTGIILKARRGHTRRLRVQACDAPSLPSKSRGSGGSAPSGVQGQSPWPFLLP